MLEFREVSKTYRNGTKALHEASFKIEDGEFVYIIGDSGAGKTTLLRLMISEETPTSGLVLMDKTNVGKLRGRKIAKYRQKLGIVFQEYHLLNNKNVFDNILFAMEVIGAKTSTSRQRVREVLSLVSLEDKARSAISELSGGQAQRVAIARAIVNQPKVLILDEPTSNLDPTLKHELLRTLERINREENTTIIMVTHDENVVNEFKKRTLVLKEGYVVADLAKGGYQAHV